MMDNYDWKPRVVNRCPLWISELNREEVVEWVIERCETDFGTLQIEYTRCDALDRSFVGRSVTASVWAVEEDEDSEDSRAKFVLVDAKGDFLSVGLAKRWTVALSELQTATDANNYLLAQMDDDDPFGFG